MVYSPQRRHAIASMGMTTHALAVLQQLYSPNILVLVSRLLVQAQIGAAPFVHPTRSLLALFFMLVLTNFSAVFLHCLDFWAGLNGGKGVVLDFVGQSYPASLTRILLLDLAMFTLQITALTISYITNHGKAIPTTSSFPHDDLLLPPEGEFPLDSDESDLESGILNRRSVRARSGVDSESNELWLDDDEDDYKPGQGNSASSRLLPLKPGSLRRCEPPLVFSLSLPYVLNLIFRLPAPPPAPRVFAGTTPAVTPAATPPRRAVPLPVVSPATAVTPVQTSSISAPDVTDDAGEADQESEEEPSDATRTGRRARGGAGIIPDMGRIPGGYWYGRGANENG